jgi:hypothetical protein
MESLNPSKTLDQLEYDYKAYLNAPAERRPELAVTMRCAISRSEIEIANLARAAETDFEQRMLHKRLIGLIELARGSLPPA